MDVPPIVIYFLQGVLLLSGAYLFWAGWQIRNNNRIDLMKGTFGRPLSSPQLVAREYALFNSVYGLALVGIVVLWSGIPLSFVSATIITTIVGVIGTSWRGVLMRLHDRRLP